MCTDNNESIGEKE